MKFVPIALNLESASFTAQSMQHLLHGCKKIQDELQT